MSLFETALVASLFALVALDPAIPAARAEERPTGARVTPAAVTPPTATSAEAVRAPRPPVIDGRDDDPVWRAAPPITQFREWTPTEGNDPRFGTVAKIAYDARNLYVFVRCYDSHPDSIIRILERRDTRTPSDMVFVELDSYHDRRTGHAFAVNAAGVKLDEAIYDDDNEDLAWDGVWDAATRVDSLGWAAEFRIPLSQLGYGAAPDETFGILIDRDIYRYKERVSWPLFHPSRPGEVSQFGTLTGLIGLGTPRRVDAAPYVVAKNASTIADNAFARASFGTLGADLQYRVASNVRLDATVNPDFGEVEADPSVLNLTALETFFDERRPFFVAERGLFQLNVNCSAVSCANEQLFYTRRIGRTPQLWSTFGDTTPAQPTTILGAGKLVGRFPGGLTVGVLDAVTRQDQAPFGDTLKTVEPGANYAVVRVQQALRHGLSTVGGMVTAVDRALDRFTAPYLPRDAYVGALDFSHRFLGDAYEVSGGVARSRVGGSSAAIAALQTDPVHYYQRTDAGLPLDSSRTTLSGDAEELHVRKVGGAHLQFGTSYMRRSPAFEINDAGFLQRADEQSWATWVGAFDRHQRRLYNSLEWNLDWWQNWSAAGLPLGANFATNLDVASRGNWETVAGVTWGQLGVSYDDRSARGGPAIRQDPYLQPQLTITGDNRRALAPRLTVLWTRGAAGHHTTLTAAPELDLKLWHRFSSSLNVSWTRNVADDQWYANYTDATGATSYTFAHLTQTTAAVTLRLNYTFTPNVSLQVYAQPFVSRGVYAEIRQLSATPRAADYVARFASYGDTAVTNHPGGFDYKAFQSNLVFRWEYRPGSTLFVVWNQGRQGTADYVGNGTYQADVRDLFRLHPANTFLVKFAYWLDW